MCGKKALFEKVFKFPPNFSFFILQLATAVNSMKIMENLAQMNQWAPQPQMQLEL